MTSRAASGVNAPVPCSLVSSPQANAQPAGPYPEAGSSSGFFAIVASPGHRGPARACHNPA